MTLDSIDTPDWSTLPAPLDDGLAAHLPGLRLPAVKLPATGGAVIDLSAPAGRGLVFVYPKMGKPGAPNPEGWDMIPGARGCTPHACAFRDRFAELTSLGVAFVVGLSSQDAAEQQEAADRLHLPFPLASDASGRLRDALRLPTFETGGMVLLKRLTLVVRDGRVEHVFYPVFPPDRNAEEAIIWLKQRGTGDRAGGLSGLL